MTYQEKLLDPRWQKLRLQILERDHWACQSCGNTDRTLHVHHLDYEPNVDPWVYPEWYLITLCDICHKDFPAQRKKQEIAIIKNLRVALLTPKLWDMAESELNSNNELLRDLILKLYQIGLEESVAVLKSYFINSNKSDKSQSFIGKTCPLCGSKFHLFADVVECKMCGCRPKDFNCFIKQSA